MVASCNIQNNIQNKREGVMQRNSVVSDKRNNIGKFAVLPDEMLVYLIGFLGDRDIGSCVSQLSFYFHDICDERFLNNLYGRRLRFKGWQEKELNLLEQNALEYKKPLQVRFSSL